MSSGSKIFVTGATGRLGRLVIDALRARVPAEGLVAGARRLDGESADGLRALGIEVREADYTKPETLRAAFRAIDRLLLISSSQAGERIQDHRNVIDAAERSGVRLLAYTSVLHADTSPLPIAEDHRATEALLRKADLPVVLLRNGWYTENYAASIPTALEQGAVLGSAGEGRISSAARADLAEAAAIVLTRADQAGRIHELAGDESYTLAEFTAAIADEAGRPVAYRDLPEEAYRAALLQAGLPEGLAGLLASSDAGAARGGLYEGGRGLSALLGRPTTPYRDVIRRALATR